MKTSAFTALAFAALLGCSVMGCQKAPEAPRANQPVKGERHSSAGVIKQFGEGNKTIVIQHQAFFDGFMDAMTMSFELQDPKMADSLKVGDKVEFTLEYTVNAFPIVSIKKTK